MQRLMEPEVVGYPLNTEQGAARGRWKMEALGEVVGGCREMNGTGVAGCCIHSCQHHDSTMRFYNFTTQIEPNDSTILLSRILDFTILKDMILLSAILP